MIPGCSGSVGASAARQKAPPRTQGGAGGGDFCPKRDLCAYEPNLGTVRLAHIIAVGRRDRQPGCRLLAGAQRRRVRRDSDCLARGPVPRGAARLRVRGGTAPERPTGSHPRHRASNLAEGVSGRCQIRGLRRGSQMTGGGGVCPVCTYADEHGWWGPDQRGTHCRGCHRSWHRKTEAHCATCHGHFSGTREFDMHLAKFGCRDPRVVPRLQLREDGVWTRTTSPPPDS